MPENMRVAVIIPAAGSSTRYGKPKIDEDLGGRPVLQRTVELFANRPEVACIVVAGPAPNDGVWEEFRLRHGDRLGLIGATICRGGKDHRWQSVKNALDAALASENGKTCTHVAVHDAARPGASTELIDRVFAAAAKHPAVIPAIDLPDTIKRVSEQAVEDKDVDPLDAILGVAGKANTSVRRVMETLARENVVLVQTPQVFEVGLLRRAYAQADLHSTDDAQLVERLGEPVVVVEGDPRNVKITRPVDVELVRKILNLRGPVERETHKRF